MPSFWHDICLDRGHMFYIIGAIIILFWEIEYFSRHPSVLKRLPAQICIALTITSLFFALNKRMAPFAIPVFMVWFLVLTYQIGQKKYNSLKRRPGRVRSPRPGRRTR
jgi:hypothetical protein